MTLKHEQEFTRKEEIFQVEGTAHSDTGWNQNDLFLEDLQNGDHSLKG